MVCVEDERRMLLLSLCQEFSFFLGRWESFSMKNKNSCPRLFPEKEIVGLFFFVLDDRMKKVLKCIGSALLYW